VKIEQIEHYSAHFHSMLDGFYALVIMRTGKTSKKTKLVPWTIVTERHIHCV